MLAPAHDLRPGEERRLRNRALIRWHMTASPAARMLASLQGMTSGLVERTEGLCAEVVSGEGQCLARYRVIVRGGNGYLYPTSENATITSVLAHSAELRAASAALASRSSALRALSAFARSRAGESRLTVSGRQDPS